MRVEFIRTQDHGDRISQEKFLREDVDLLEAQTCHALLSQGDDTAEVGEIDYLLKDFKKPSFSSSLRNRVLTKSSGFLFFTVGTLNATSSMALRMPSRFG
jgi:hypothetical protein